MSGTCRTRQKWKMCRNCSRRVGLRCMSCIPVICLVSDIRYKKREIGGCANNNVGYSVRIDISIDPFSGRNPSYCFVDLSTKELAERAMAELDGADLLGRPVKIKPGVVKSASERQQQQRTGMGAGTGSIGDGLSSGSPRANRAGSSPLNADRWRRDDNLTSASTTPTKFSNMSTYNPNADPSKRLYVGGLPRLTDQEAISSNVTQFFKGYNLYVVSSLPSSGHSFNLM